MFQEAFKKKIEETFGIGSELDGGGLVLGERLRFDFEQQHYCEDEGHTDIRVKINRKDQSSFYLLDCVGGFGETREEKAEAAAHLWCNTTAAAVFELFALDGSFASHYQGGEAEGIPGWHAIWSPLIGYGFGESGDALQKWTVETKLLAKLGPALLENLPEGDGPHGAKLFFGWKDSAEVRVNGEVDKRRRRHSWHWTGPASIGQPS